MLRFARLRCAGVPVNFAATIALSSPRLAEGNFDEGDVENHIKTRLIDDKAVPKKFELGGRMKGVEFYDCLFFYLTRWLKARPSGQTPRRNLAEFLEEYLVHFKDGDKWLYRAPDAAEAEALRKSHRPASAAVFGNTWPTFAAKVIFRQSVVQIRRRSLVG